MVLGLYLRGLLLGIPVTMFTASVVPLGKVIWKAETPVASELRGRDKLQTLSGFPNV